jgi:uncharacterized FlaG/YvyC family protein
MHKCYTPCIYYHELHDKSKTPTVKVICDIREGQEIRNIPNEEIQNCEHYKTYNEVKENSKKIFQMNP